MSRPLSDTPHCGDVFYLSDSRNTESTAGRPVFIISSNEYNENHSSVVIAWIAGNNKDNNPHNIHFTLQPNFEGYALCGQIGTVFKDRLADYAGTADFRVISKVLLTVSEIVPFSRAEEPAKPFTPTVSVIQENSTSADEVNGYEQRITDLQRQLDEVTQQLETAVGVKDALLDSMVEMKAAMNDDEKQETIRAIELQTLNLERNSWRAQATIYRRQYEALLAFCKACDEPSMPATSSPDSP